MERRGSEQIDANTIIAVTKHASNKLDRGLQDQLIQLHFCKSINILKAMDKHDQVIFHSRKPCKPLS